MRKTLLLASIAFIGVPIATAQQAGINSQIASDALPDPFVAPTAHVAVGGTPAQMQAQVDALAFGAGGAFSSTATFATSSSTSDDAQSNPDHSFDPSATGTLAQSPVGNAFLSESAADRPATFGAATGTTPPANPFAMAKVEPNEEGVAEKPVATISDEARIDETALRYYASQRDMVRVGAEIRRIKTLYPNWLPPSDLFAPRGGSEEQALWALYAKGQFAEIETDIARIKSEKQGWTPTQDLLNKLEDGKARQAISSAAAASNWTAAIAAAQARPSLLVCTNMDVLWNIGEGYARSGNMARAYDLYAYVLANCEPAAERLATFQKANALLPPQGITALLAYARITPNGGREFEKERFDTLRQRLSEVGSGKSSQLPPVDQLQAYVDYVRRSRSADDMALIGWYFFGQKQWQRAAEWFRAGMDAGGSAKVTEGYILALRNDDRISDAEEIAYQNRHLSPDVAKVYIEMVADEMTAGEGSEDISSKEIERFADVVEEKKSPLGSQSLGWHLANAGDLKGAQEWFEKSVAWMPTEEGVVGLAVVATRLKQPDELAAIKARYKDDFPAVGDFKEYKPAQSIRASSSTKAERTASSPKRKQERPNVGRSGDSLMAAANERYKQGDYEGALQALDEREARRGKEYGAEILRGWANHRLGRYDTARKVFAAEDRRRSTKDTRFGIGASSNSQYRMWPDSENKCKVWSKC